MPARATPSRSPATSGAPTLRPAIARSPGTTRPTRVIQPRALRQTTRSRSNCAASESSTSAAPHADDGRAARAPTATRPHAARPSIANGTRDARSATAISAWSTDRGHLQQAGDRGRQRAGHAPDDAGHESPHRQWRRQRHRDQVGGKRHQRDRTEHRDEHRGDADLRGGSDAEHLAHPRRTAQPGGERRASSAMPRLAARQQESDLVQEERVGHARGRSRRARARAGRRQGGRDSRRRARPPPSRSPAAPTAPNGSSCRSTPAPPAPRPPARGDRDGAAAARGARARTRRFPRDRGEMGEAGGTELLGERVGHPSGVAEQEAGEQRPVGGCEMLGAGEHHTACPVCDLRQRRRARARRRAGRSHGTRRPCASIATARRTRRGARTTAEHRVSPADRRRGRRAATRRRADGAAARARPPSPTRTSARALNRAASGSSTSVATIRASPLVAGAVNEECTSPSCARCMTAVPSRPKARAARATRAARCTSAAASDPRRAARRASGRDRGNRDPLRRRATIPPTTAASTTSGPNGSRARVTR